MGCAVPRLVVVSGLHGMALACVVKAGFSPSAVQGCSCLDSAVECAQECP